MNEKRFVGQYNEEVDYFPLNYIAVKTNQFFFVFSADGSGEMNNTSFARIYPHFNLRGNLNPDLYLVSFPQPPVYSLI